MKTINYGTETAPKWFVVATVTINGEEMEIIPAFTNFSIKRKNFSDDKIFPSIDKSKILDTIFFFTDSKKFFEEKVELYDYHDREITASSDDMPPIMVYLDKADNVNLLGLVDSPLPAKFITCESVADAYQRVSTTAYLSQCPSKDDWIGLAGIASNDELLMMIRIFSNDYEMSGTTAQGYFGLSTTTSFMQSKAVSVSALLPKGEYRTRTQAEHLMKSTVQAFGAKAAKQTRYIKAINYCISDYGFEIVCEALNNIGATEKLHLDASKCEDKVQCLQGIIIEQAILLHEKLKQ